jgi:uncharacterized membrane protein YgcG
MLYHTCILLARYLSARARSSQSHAQRDERNLSFQILESNPGVLAGFIYVAILLILILTTVVVWIGEEANPDSYPSYIIFVLVALIFGSVVMGVIEILIVLAVRHHIALSRYYNTANELQSSYIFETLPSHDDVFIRGGGGGGGSGASGREEEEDEEEEYDVRGSIE